MKKLKSLFTLVLFPVLLFAQSETKVLDEKKIINEEINLVIYIDKELKQPILTDPNWKKLQRNISRKYEDVDASKLVVGARIRYYSIKKDWERFADAYLTNLETYDKVDQMKNYRQLTWSVNGVLYDRIFKNVNNKKLLKRAAVQAKKVVDNPYSVKEGRTEEIKQQSMANLIDTYANLLYKSGDVKKAIKWQDRAVELSSGQNIEFKAKLDIMKKGDRLDEFRK